MTGFVVSLLQACAEPSAIPSETNGEISENPGPVHVTVTREGEPIEGIRVIFQGGGLGDLR